MTTKIDDQKKKDEMVMNCQFEGQESNMNFTEKEVQWRQQRSMGKNSILIIR